MKNNTTGEGVAMKPPLFILDMMIMTSLSITAIVGNILVFVCYVKFRTLRCVTNVFMLSLSASDLFVAFLSLPYSIAVLLFRIDFSETSLGDLIYITCDMVPSILSIYSLTMVALDRALAITKPFHHQKYVTRRIAWISVGIVWLFVCLLISVRYMVSHRTFTLHIILASFVVPVTIMIICYSVIGCVAKSHANRLNKLEKSAIRFREQDQSNVENNNMKQMLNEDSSVPLVVYEGKNKECLDASCFKSSMLNISPRSTITTRSKSIISGFKVIRRDFKAALTLSLILTCFVVSWTPFMAVNIVFYDCNGEKSCISKLNESLVKYFKMLHYSNSALNPILFGLLNQRWRTAFKKVLFCYSRNSYYSESRSEMFGW